MIKVLMVETEGKRIATHIIIEWGLFQLFFARDSSFHRTRTGGFGRLKEGQPLKRRTDRGEDLDVPSVPFWQAVNMARKKFSETRGPRKQRKI